MVAGCDVVILYSLIALEIVENMYCQQIQMSFRKPASLNLDAWQFQATSWMYCASGMLAAIGNSYEQQLRPGIDRHVRHGGVTTLRGFCPYKQYTSVTFAISNLFVHLRQEKCLKLFCIKCF
ncbi:hypothetical protein EVAR_70732_1 [Eumeta japonica]|uniref:Uncharacterized protein n=1 Tax=Eumeta variegata TaxID=151549 RepID=A0A4C2AB87_EUMVA|nr:hypothetical protein EVAR_70732_1 [Eumeta japonica]